MFKIDTGLQFVWIAQLHKMEIKLLSCPLCLKPHFENVDKLRSSLINVATSHLTCPVCSESLLGLDKLTIHLFSHISNHLNEEKEATQAEKEPLQVAEEPMEYKTNEGVVTSDDNSNKQNNCIYCDICNFCFNDESILEMHQKLLHQTSPDKKTGMYSYHCHLCSKKFKMKGSLMVHLRVAHYGFGHNSHEDDSAAQENDQNEMIDKQLNVKKTGNPKAIDNKQWECDICSKMFTTKYFLKKHKRLHTGEMPYYCVQCNKSFTFQQSYHKHMLYHSADKPHVCSECGRAFKELSTLHNHERIHSGERPFACETCGKRFRQRVSYLVHRRIHTGVMPYKCTVCDKSFRYKVSQRSHKCTGGAPSSEPENFTNEIYNGSNYSIKLLDSTNLNLEVPLNNCNLNVICSDGVENFHIVNSVPSQMMTNFDLSSQTFADSSQESRDKLQVPSPEQTTPKEVATTDFYSMVLSPLLPEVQSLRLNCSSMDNAELTREGTSHNEALKTINEESLKELLYGPPQGS